MRDDVVSSYNTVNPEALRPIGHEVPVSCSLCRVYLSGTGEISDGRGVCVACVGIIANPSSGKDIRLVAHGSVFNNEKVNIVRVLLGLTPLAWIRF